MGAVSLTGKPALVRTKENWIRHDPVLTINSPEAQPARMKMVALRPMELVVVSDTLQGINQQITAG